MTSDDEKLYKNQLTQNRSRKDNLAKDLTKSGRKHYDPYESDVNKKAKYRNVANSVKKTSNKASLSMAMDKRKLSAELLELNKGNGGNVKAKIGNTKAKGNISMDMYERANQLESKTKRHQEERLQNILKMHDSHVNRGVGIANKNRNL